MENISITSNMHTTAHLAGIAAPKTETQQAEAKIQRIVASKESTEPEVEQKTPEEAHLATVKAAAKQVLVNCFVVSDTRFTIYKSNLGDPSSEPIYVTRFTSLRDGKVTVVPESKLFSNASKASGTIMDGLI